MTEEDLWPVTSEQPIRHARLRPRPGAPSQRLLVGGCLALGLDKRVPELVYRQVVILAKFLEIDCCRGRRGGREVGRGGAKIGRGKVPGCAQGNQCGVHVAPGDGHGGGDRSHINVQAAVDDGVDPSDEHALAAFIERFNDMPEERGRRTMAGPSVTGASATGPA